ncbi:hypothetical protein B4144_1541 [Bacillus atrophaeus]|nr:hypothetical protein B4144_1541 [Bacillus atrophaeus]
MLDSLILLYSKTEYNKSLEQKRTIRKTKDPLSGNAFFTEHSVPLSSYFFA